MEIIRLQSVTEDQVGEILTLMRELDPEMRVTAEMIRRSLGEPRTCFFALMDGTHIVGCASLCVIYSPTGCKVHVEDVVVLSSYRGRNLGRCLMEHLINYARTEFPGADVYLTSRPQRVAANGLYQSLGFRRRETNVYKLSCRDATEWE